MSPASPLRLVPDRRPAAGERGALFPVTRFPAGAAAPVGFLVVSLLVAAVALAVLVRSPAQQSIAASTVAAQRASADQLRDLVLAGVTTSTQALDGQADRLASVLETDTASGMVTLRTAVPELGAIAVIDARTGAVLGREGDVPTDRSRRPELGRPELRVAGVVPVAQAVMTVPAGPWLRVVASTDLRLPPPPPVVGRHLLLMSGRGDVLGRVGDASTGVRTDESSVLARVAAAQNAGDGAVAAGGDVSDDAALAAGGRDPSRTVAHASWSALGLPLMSGSPPVAAAVMSRATPEVQEGGSPALWHAAGLAMLAGAAGAVLHGALVAPLRRVRADGERAVLHPRVPVRRSRVREVDAVAAAFGRRVRRPRRSHGVRAAIVVPAVGSVLLAALAIGVTTFERETGVRTADHVEAVRRDAVATADELRRRIDDGAARVHSSVVPLPGDPASGDLVARADALAAVDGPFRSVSIVDRRGAVLYRAGRLPLRAGEPVPATDGVAQLNTAGRVPLLVATGWTPERSHAVLAEYDVAALLELLRSRDAHMRVADAGERGVLDGQAAEAFRPLPEGPLRDAVLAVRSGVPTAVPATVDGVPTAVVAEPLGDRDATATLGWTLVARQPLADLDFRHDTATRAVLAVAGLAAVAVVGATAWCWLVVLSPLRRLGRSVTAGHRTHVVERADEVGALAAALNRRTR